MLWEKADEEKKEQAQWTKYAPEDEAEERANNLFLLIYYIFKGRAIFVVLNIAITKTIAR